MSILLDRTPRIVQGLGALDQIGEAVRSLIQGETIALLVADPGLPAAVRGAAQAALEESGLFFAVYDDVRSDPKTSQADAAARLARSIGAEVVVSLGGGSAMDVGKIVAAITHGAHDAGHYALGAHVFPEKALFNVCIPTTSGTGSEATRTAVLTDPDGIKIWLWGNGMKPDLIVLDPEVTTGLPPHLTAATGVDALVHAIEACTNANANTLNAIYCHEAIRLVSRWLSRAVADPRDLEARAGMQWAATLAGVGIDNCGTAIAHNIAHALASLRPVHHGRAVGLAMMATLAWNIEDDDGRFSAVAEAMGVGPDARRLPETFERLVRSVGLEVDLKGEGYDIAPEALAEQMARPENLPMRLSNHRPVEDSDLFAFADALLSQR